MIIMSNREPPNTSLIENFSSGARLSVVSICLDTETRGLLKLFVESTSMVRLRPDLDDYRIEDNDSVADWIGDPPPDICLIDFDKDLHRAAVAAERIHASAPETAIFAVSSHAQPDLIIQAMRSGCNEYLLKPIDREQMLNAVVRVGGRKREKKETYNANVMTFIGAKGGCGVTTLVAQLGALLANECSKQTLAIDLHPNFGDAALHLGLSKSRYHSFELIENADRLDAELLQSLVAHHSSGLDLVPAPEEIDPARHILPGAVARTFDFLRLHYRFVLVDLPPGVDDQNLEFIRYSDEVYLITVAEVSALRNVSRYLDYLTRMEVPRERIRVVVNRHHKRGSITDEQIEKVIRGNIFWKIPNQYFQVVKTINSGDPIAQLSNSEVMRNLKGWAEAISSKSGMENNKTKESRRMLRFFNL